MTEAWGTGSDDGSTIFRFRATYSGGEKPEVRVVVDGASNKVKGLWVKPWSDSLS